MHLTQVDHFGFANADTFKQRYLVNADHWNSGGPIFFYTGNEGDITWFCNNTVSTVMIQSFQTNRSGLTVQTQIRLLLDELSDQGLHCLLFYLHLFDEIP